jgi:hypothetical protein
MKTFARWIFFDHLLFLVKNRNLPINTIPHLPPKELHLIRDESSQVVPIVPSLLVANCFAFAVFSIKMRLYGTFIVSPQYQK